MLRRSGFQTTKLMPANIYEFLKITENLVQVKFFRQIFRNGNQYKNDAEKFYKMI